MKKIILIFLSFLTILLIGCQQDLGGKAYDVESGCTFFDVDGNGKAKALSDGMLILRYLYGFEGDALINGVIATDATRTTSESVVNYMESLKVDYCLLDVDGNGEAKPLSDGMLIIRYLFGFEGDPLIKGAIESGATRDNSDAILEFLDSCESQCQSSNAICGQEGQDIGIDDECCDELTKIIPSSYNSYLDQWVQSNSAACIKIDGICENPLGYPENLESVEFISETGEYIITTDCKPPIVDCGEEGEVIGIGDQCCGGLRKIMPSQYNAQLDQWVQLSSPACIKIDGICEDPLGFPENLESVRWDAMHDEYVLTTDCRPPIVDCGEEGEVIGIGDQCCGGLRKIMPSQYNAQLDQWVQLSSPACIKIDGICEDPLGFPENLESVRWDAMTQRYILTTDCR